MITIKVNVADGASPMLREVISGLTGARAAELNEQGGRAAQEAARAYHREFDAAGGWRGKRNLSTLTGGSDFGAAVAGGWELQSFDGNGAVISNAARHYAFKVSGGTIKNKNWDYLTIPLIPEAKGMLARDYVSNTGRKLFRPRRSNGTLANVLAEKSENGKGFRSVYSLVKSVTMGPWPRAVPPADVIAGEFMEKWRKGITEVIEEL